MGTVVRNAEDKVHKERKTNLLVLVRDFLAEEGYLETLKSFEAETRLPSECTLCDNVDLGTVVEDFEAYYFTRFKKYPKITKKISSKNDYTELKGKEKRRHLPIVKQKSEPSGLCVEKTVGVDFLKVAAVGAKEDHLKPQLNDQKLWKGLGTFVGYSEEWRTFADLIGKEVIDRNLNVKWSDVVGLESAKQHLRESIVYPMKYPDLFRGITSPWKGLLLYGPSGTGKTLLAKAVATECSTTFFNISASSLVSKWRGESEKLVRVMFELARHQAPSTIFIDELDALASKRDCPTEHEASRRLKSEFLVQLDGLLESSDQIFLLTTSNLPWDLDPAILRRLEKRIFVDLPDLSARKSLFASFLPVTINRYLKTDMDFVKLAEESDGYSGADIKLVCKEALMTAMRSIIPLLEKNDPYGKVQCKVINSEHVLDALEIIKPVAGDSVKFKMWPN
ncbi:hypothetical protein GE061_003228 [Apolygus lucorum]|uniref:AAA+ ATPase domain-containing protein n=1 Tax=Apolygus lucorum TaxID=248454 RepID=A0A6A4JKB5_APOLU|nr:hypothetical protein GE061_003228 [Apolygus lucorum]